MKNKKLSNVSGGTQSTLDPRAEKFKSILERISNPNLQSNMTSSITSSSSSSNTSSSQTTINGELVKNSVSTTIIENDFQF